MMRTARRCFPKSIITNDRFHVHKLYYEAIDELIISLRWMARDIENAEMERCRKEVFQYVPFRHANGDTRKQLLAKAKHILTKTMPDGHLPRNTGLTLFSSFIQRLRKPTIWPWNLPIFSIKSRIRIRQDSISPDGMTMWIIWKWGSLKLSRTLSAITTTLSLISLFIAQLMAVLNLQRQGEDFQISIPLCKIYSVLSFQTLQTLCLIS